MSPSSGAHAYRHRKAATLGETHDGNIIWEHCRRLVYENNHWTATGDRHTIRSACQQKEKKVGEAVRPIIDYQAPCIGIFSVTLVCLD